MFQSYITERYPEYQSIPMILDSYIDNLQPDAVISDVGFATYSLVGDAAIIWDIYVDPAKRNKHAASNLADAVVTKARQLGHRTLIGFSEKAGSGDRTLGQQACKGYGFKLAHETSNDMVFIKGI